MMQPVLIAAGGTGGHVIPALAVADELRKQDIPVVWLGTKSGLEARLVTAAGIDIKWISVAGLRGKNIIETLVGPFKLMRSCLQSLKYVYSLKPRAVLGMGGFVSGPVGIAALIMRKPLVLHEQNAVAGMTNRWLSRFATRVFAAWPNAFSAQGKEEIVGNPVSRSIVQLSLSVQRPESSNDQPLRILIVGGSRGARVLNEVVPEAIALLESEVQVHHQAGMADSELVRQRYAKAASAQWQVSEFIDDMATAYQSADLIICRSGAMTVTEISALGLPSILVPFPYAVDDHQTKNAEHLSEVGAAVLMPQKNFNAKTLAGIIRPLLKDRGALLEMSDAARRCFVPSAATVVASALVEVSS